jgi:hypothetical protein
MYMGFGMRKEVYTRKPRKSFEKIKRVFGIGKQNAPNEELTDTHIKVKRFRHFYQTWIFRCIAIFTIGSFLWLTWLKESYQGFREHRFQKTGLVTHYTENKKLYASLRRYFDEREDRLVTIGRQDESNGFFVGIKEANTSNNAHDSLVYRLRVWGYRMNSLDFVKPVVKQGNLWMDSDDAVYPCWIVEYNDIDLSSIDQSMIDYMKASRKEFNAIGQLISRSNLVVSKDQGPVSITFHHGEFGEYQIIFSDTIPSSKSIIIDGHEEITESGRIESGVCWTTTKIEYERNYFWDILVRLRDATHK